MGRRTLLVLMVFFTPSFGLSAVDELFDLATVPYFEEGRLSFIQTISDEGARHGPRRGGFMPSEGVVEISFQSRKEGAAYVMTTASYQDGSLLYSTEAVVDSVGITMRYVMYGVGGDPTYDYRYDAESGTAWVDYKNEDDERVRKSATVANDAYSMMTIPYIIGALRIAGSERHSLGAVVGNGKKLGLYVQRLGTETVRVGGKLYSCSKIEMGFSGLIGLLVPKMVFWVDERTKIPIRQDMMGSSIIEYVPED